MPVCGNYLFFELPKKIVLNPKDGTASGKFQVSYFDSANNNLIQIADVFANLFYSHVKTDAYTEELQKLKDSGILRFIFEFPK